MTRMRTSLRDGGKELLRSCVQHRPVTLRSGEGSGVYVDCSLAYPWLSLLAEQIMEAADEACIKWDAVCGVPWGGVPWAAAVAAEIDGTPLLVLRTDAEPVRVEGAGGNRVMIVEDVCTTGRSVSYCYQELLYSDYEIAGVVSLVDRGGVSKFQKLTKATAVCTLDELLSE